jgi:hypothetical protein
MSAGRDEIARTPRADVIGLRPSGTIPPEDRFGFMEALFGSYYLRGKMPRNDVELWNLASENRNLWNGTEESPIFGWTFEELCEKHPDGSLQELRWAFENRIENSLEYQEWKRFWDRDGEPIEWVIPGLLAPGDRMMLTAKVSSGKSLFCQQLAIQTASGIHPFTGDETDPLGVLLVDFENPRDELGSRLSAMTRLAGDRWISGNFRMLSFVGAFITDEGVRDEIVEMARESDLLVIGPLYKMSSGNQNDDIIAREITDFLDWIRSSSEWSDQGPAVIVEGHPVKEGNARGVAGSRVFQQWPEIGIQLEPDWKGKVNLAQWRTPRRSQGIEIPAALGRDPEWNRS